MKRIWAVILVLVCNGLAQTDDATIQRASRGMERLKSQMKDPNSFVLEAAYLLKPNKKGESEICYFYNARNSFGGYGGTSEATLLRNDRIYLIDDDLQKNPLFILTDGCKPKNRIVDLTADIRAAVDPTQTSSSQIVSPADRPKMIAAENAGFKKQDIAGYAEIVDDTYIVHSERANSIRFHANMIGNRDYMSALQRVGITTLIYTNDKDVKFVYDTKANLIVEPKPTEAVTSSALAPTPSVVKPVEYKQDEVRGEVVPQMQPQQPDQAPDSLGDAARRAKQRKACLELTKDNPSISCK